MACWTRPLEALAAAVLDTDALPMKIFWKASCVPDAAVRTVRSIAPVADEPGTSDQSAILPEKIPWIVACDRSAIGLAGFVAMQIASLAILLKNRPPGSESFAS